MTKTLLKSLPSFAKTLFEILLWPESWAGGKQWGREQLWGMSLSAPPFPELLSDWKEMILRSVVPADPDHTPHPSSNLMSLRDARHMN